MDVAVPPRRELKGEDDDDARMADGKPSYRSWKKKYRKMRVVFDQKMHEGEELHRLEQAALDTARRLAVEKDRLLDLLLDINTSPQIPPERRIDLSLPSDNTTSSIGIRPLTPTGSKSFKTLLADVPHFTYSAAEERFPDLFADLQAGRDSPADASHNATNGQQSQHPPSFLSADDIDNYIYQVDSRLAARAAAKSNGASSPKLDLLPTLAPVALSNGYHGASANGPNGTSSIGSKESIKDAAASASRDFALRNPTSVYNWLRKHAPKTFLQDGETGHAGGEAGDDASGAAGHHHALEGGGRPASGRGSRGGGERRSRGSTRGGRGSRGGRRSRGGGGHGHGADGDAMDLETDGTAVELGTPTSAGGKGTGKRKRVIDDDPGYRPKGGSSRPAKKKLKGDAGELALGSSPGVQSATKPRKMRGSNKIQLSRPRAKDSDEDEAIRDRDRDEAAETEDEATAAAAAADGQN